VSETVTLSGDFAIAVPEAAYPLVFAGDFAIDSLVSPFGRTFAGDFAIEPEPPFALVLAGDFAILDTGGTGSTVLLKRDDQITEHPIKTLIDGVWIPE
jgi:hypothetical protein